jgi:hypothetical protein
MEIDDILRTLHEDRGALQQKIDAVQTAIDAIEKAWGLSPAIPSPVRVAEKAVKAHQRPSKYNGKGADPKKRTEKECHKCRSLKELSEFPKNAACKDGHTGTCKECTYQAAKKRHPKATQSDPTASGIVCKLCHAPCSSADRLASHMRAVHDMAAA